MLAVALASSVRRTAEARILLLSCHLTKPATPAMSNNLTPSNFSSIPVLDYPLLHTDRAAFLTQLRHALIHVGFLYLRDAPVDTASVVEQVPRFFALQQEAKDRLAMTNNEHFLGYTKMGTEWTKGAQDWREQIDIATPHENDWKQGDPDYLRLWGPAQVCLRLEARPANAH